MSSELERINELLDWYECLLTEKQKEVMSLYYRDDLSLSEIAEDMNISRSAVSDLIRRVVKTLEEYENKLLLVDKFHKRNALYDKLKHLNIEEVEKIVEALKEYE